MATNISPYLEGIRMGARMAARNALSLPARPDFETNAEAELERVRAVLTEALTNVVKAQSEYQNKKVMA
jgi:hypothetical protein